MISGILGDYPLHPGVWLRLHVVESQNLDISALAKHLGMSRPALVAILSGRHVLSAKLAIGFEKAFGVDASMLCEMQKRFDLAEARANSEDINVRPFVADH